MPRARRPHLPGTPFHLTARVQNQLPLFVGIELAAARICLQVAERSDGELLAYAVMPNHLHLVYVQGARDLASFMQPLLTRVALLLRRRRKQHGHAFERRFRHSACTDARHLRNAIAYTHLNPLRAGLCERTEQYGWTSHANVCAADERLAIGRCAWGAVNALRLFAPERDADLSACRETYLQFLEWRRRMDMHLISGGSPEDAAAPKPVCVAGGDEHWQRCYSQSMLRAAVRGARRRPLTDLRDVVRTALLEFAPGMSVDLVRSGGRMKALVAVRNLVIIRALEAGHPGVRIARFLRLSEAVVSRQRARRKT